MLDIDLLKKYTTAVPAVAAPVKSAEPVLDSCKGAKCEEKTEEEEGKALDAADLAAAHVANQVAIEAAEIVQTWLEQEPAEGETYADVLQDLFVEGADENEDGELSDTDTVLIEASLNAAYDYMLSKGVSEEDAYKLLSEWNVDAAERVHDLLIEKMPDGDAAEDDISNFVFGTESAEAVMDSSHGAGEKYFTVSKTGRRDWHVGQGNKVKAKTRNLLRKALKKHVARLHSSAVEAKRLRSRRRNAHFYKH